MVLNGRKLCFPKKSSAPFPLLPALLSLRNPDSSSRLRTVPTKPTMPLFDIHVTKEFKSCDEGSNFASKHAAVILPMDMAEHSQPLSLLSGMISRTSFNLWTDRLGTTHPAILLEYLRHAWGIWGLFSENPQEARLLQLYKPQQVACKSQRNLRSAANLSYCGVNPRQLYSDPAKDYITSTFLIFPFRLLLFQFFSASRKGRGIGWI